MHRKTLLELLQAYRAPEAERPILERFVHFVSSQSDCFERSLLQGHVTASAWVFDRSRTRVLLTHHVKLGRWLQLGGHADGDTDVLSVAIREVLEESGLTRCSVLTRQIFDIDIHEIPQYGSVPAHNHYDVRFLIEADASEILVPTDESHEVRWVDLEKVAQFTQEESILRMLEKSKKWRDTP